MKKGKETLKIVLVVAVILLGASMMAYPLLSSYLSGISQSRLEESYSKAVSEKTDEELEAAYQAAVAYNEFLANHTIVQTEDESGNSDEYNTLLNLNGDGIMGYVEIPSIDVLIPVYHGVDSSVLERGAGHMPSTSLPVGGSSTHCVISGHSGMAAQPLFTDLQELVIGDTFFLHVLGRDLVYEIDQIKVVKPSDTEDLTIISGGDYVTLVTCTPYGINTHRLLVRGRRVEAVSQPGQTEQTETEPELSNNSHKSVWLHKYLAGLLIGVGVFAGLCGIAVCIWLIWKKRKKEKT